MFEDCQNPHMIFLPGMVGVVTIIISNYNYIESITGAIYSILCYDVNNFL